MNPPPPLVVQASDREAADRIETIEEAADIIGNRILGQEYEMGLKMETWVEGRTMTVMFHDTMQFAKFRLVSLRDSPTPSDMRGEPE